MGPEEQTALRGGLGSLSTIQVIVREDGDERALQELLGDEYEVVIDADLQSVDCYLLDDRTLLAYHNELQQVKRTRHPTFCPVLLIQRDDTRVKTDQLLHTRDGGPALVDEVVSAPITQSTLHRRLQNLLVRREHSAELSEQYEQVHHQFRRVFEASNDAIFIVDPSADEIIDCNPAACNLVGDTREETIALTLSEIFYVTDEAASVLDQLQDIHRGKGWTGDFVCIAKGGKTRQVAVSATTVVHEGRDAVLLSARDITDRKRREARIEALDDATRDLIEAETHDEITDLAVRATTDILDMPINAIWQHIVIDVSHCRIDRTTAYGRTGTQLHQSL